MADYQEYLYEAIERLYLTFKPYEPGQHIEGCPCCVNESDQILICSKPLRSLTAEDLNHYSYKALTTWGGENDFRYFLPRLFELQAEDLTNLCNPEILYGKLSYADWLSWPIEEQQAISLYFDAMWRFLLTSREPDGLYLQAGDYLCAISQAVDVLTPYLEQWAELGSRPLAHLHRFIEDNRVDLEKDQLQSAFWGEQPAQMRQVIQWIRNVNQASML